MEQELKTQAAEEARRLRSALRRAGPGGQVTMVVTVQERAAIWAELSEREQARVRLLTGWPWAEPALASTSICKAA